jgi:hypothetical protein
MRSFILAVAAVGLLAALPIGAQAAGANTGKALHVNQRTITADLKKAGFTNIQVHPVAFVARAIDKQGHPVLMAFRPHSFEAVTALTATPSGNTNNNGNNSNNSNNNNGSDTNR